MGVSGRLQRKMTTARTMVGLGHYVSYKLTNDAREQAEKLKQQVAPVTK